MGRTQCRSIGVVWSRWGNRRVTGGYAGGAGIVVAIQSVDCETRGSTESPGTTRPLDSRGGVEARLHSLLSGTSSDGVPTHCIEAYACTTT